MLLPTMARTSQTLTQNQTPSAMRKVARRSHTRLMSQKKSIVLSDLMKTTPPQENRSPCILKVWSPPGAPFPDG